MKFLNNKKINIVILTTLFYLFFSGFFVTIFAADSRCGTAETTLKPLNFSFNVPLPGFKNNASSIEIDCLTLGDYITYIYKFTIGVTGLLAVFMITIGGIIWIFAGGNSSKVTRAKQYITGAISGILLAIGSYSILYIINPQLVEVKPVQIPLVQKSLLAICPDSGLKETNDKKTFVAVTDSKNTTTGQDTWCGMEYKVEGSENGASCWGVACEKGGNVKKICTPFVNGTSDESLNVGKYEKYKCIDSIETAKKNLIRACNSIDDTVDNNKKAQNEDQGACDDVNAQMSRFPSGTFATNEKCVWLDYPWLNPFGAVTDTDGCRWCPNSYYKVIEKKMSEGKCDLFSKGTDQPNGLCTVEEGCTAPGIDSDNHGGSDHEYAVDACVSILYPKLCPGKN